MSDEINPDEIEHWELADEIKRLVVVLEYPRPLSQERVEGIKRIWERYWPEAKVLVLDDGLRLAGVLTPKP